MPETCNAILSLYIEDGSLGSGRKSSFGLHLKVVIKRFPVTRVAIQDDDTKAGTHRKNFGPLGLLSGLTILIIVRPEVSHRREVLLPFLEGGDVPLASSSNRLFRESIRSPILVSAVLSFERSIACLLNALEFRLFLHTSGLRPLESDKSLQPRPW